MAKLKRALATGLMAALLAFTLAGCAQSEQTPEGSANTGEASQEPAQQSNQVVDAYGRTVELPDSVETAATVGSGARFVVYAGGQDKLIAVTEMETEASPARPYTVAHESLFSSLPSTSNGNHLMETSVNTEELLSLHPDVIISSRSAAECDELQEAIGIPVVGISYQDQLFSDDVYTSIEVVGEALGTSDHADAVVAKMKEWQEDLDSRTASIADEDKPTCYVGAVNYKGAKSFGGTYVQYAPLEAVNAINVADEIGQAGSVEVELEQIGEWNPDFMFLNAGNMDLMKQDYANNQEFFDSLTAFQSGNLYTQPSYNYNGTNVEMGICDAYFIGFTVFPDQFSDLDAETVYQEVFETMLGTDYYQTMKENGMDFKQLSIAA